MASEEGEDRGPSFKEAFKGTAHFYDMIKKHTSGVDPQTRKMVDNLDKITLEDALDNFSRRVDGEVNETEPHVDIVDTDYGVEVVMDCRRTEVEAGALVATVQEDRRTVTIKDPESSWFTNISPNDPDEQVAGVEVPDAEVGFARVRVFYESAQLAAGVDGESRLDENTPVEPEDPIDSADTGASIVTGDDVDGYPTLNEALEENQWFHDFLEGVAGEESVSLLTSMWGDHPITDLPFDMNKPSEIQKMMEDMPDDPGSFEGLDDLRGGQSSDDLLSSDDQVTTDGTEDDDDEDDDDEGAESEPPAA